MDGGSDPTQMTAGTAVVTSTATPISAGLTAKTSGGSAASKLDKQVTHAATRARVRADYLMEKYAGRWKTNMWKVPAVTLKLTQTTWLQVGQ